MATLAELRTKIPQLQGLDDQQALNVIHQVYYPTADKADLGLFLGVATPAAPAEEQGFLSKAADLGLGFASGAVGATKALADAAGANNAASRALADADTGITRHLSQSAQDDQQQQSAIMKEAEGKGVYEGVKAGVRAFSVAPLQTAVTGLGSVVPILAGTAATAFTGGAAPLVAGGAIGATMGAGTVKGTIFDDIKRRSMAAGMSEADAIDAATKAQEYGGDNTESIALGAGLGAADAATGVSAAANRVMRNAIRPGVSALATGSTRGVIGRAVTGMAGEMPLEAMQGGQERYASNTAAQKAGFNADAWDGVVSQATLESLASAGPGAAFGVMHKAAPAPLPDIAPIQRNVGDIANIQTVQEEISGQAAPIPDQQANAEALINPTAARWVLNRSNDDLASVVNNANSGAWFKQVAADELARRNSQQQMPEQRKIDAEAAFGALTPEQARIEAQAQVQRRIDAEAAFRALPEPTINDIQQSGSVDDAIAAATSVVNPLTAEATSAEVVPASDPVLTSLPEQQALLADLERSAGMPPAAERAIEPAPAASAMPVSQRESDPAIVEPSDPAAPRSVSRDAEINPTSAAQDESALAAPAMLDEMSPDLTQEKIPAAAPQVASASILPAEYHDLARASKTTEQFWKGLNALKVPLSGRAPLTAGYKALKKAEASAPVATPPKGPSDEVQATLQNGAVRPAAMSDAQSGAAVAIDEPGSDVAPANVDASNQPATLNIPAPAHTSPGLARLQAMHAAKVAKKTAVLTKIRQAKVAREAAKAPAETPVAVPASPAAPQGKEVVRFTSRIKDANGQYKTGNGMAPFNAKQFANVLSRENPAIQYLPQERDNGQFDVVGHEKTVDTKVAEQEPQESGQTQGADDVLVGQKAAFSQSAQSASEILDAAGVIGKERIDALKDVKTGAITAEELSQAYPEKEESPADTLGQSLHQDIAGGATATDLLSRIASESVNPQYRAFAQRLIDLGIQSSVEMGSLNDQKFDVKNQDRYVFSAAYSPKRDAVILFRPDNIERNLLHEFTHAATYKAIRRKGVAVLQMKALHAHVEESGQLGGMYGMENIDEFVAEAFSNPEFQEGLREIPGTAEGGAFKTAWDRLVNIVRQIIGLPKSSITALDQAMRIGADVMMENAAAKQSESTGNPVPNDNRLLGNVRDSTVGQAFNTLRSAGTLSEASDTIKAMLHSSQTFSLLNRTIGTQYHKATKSAPFKRVFTAYNNQTDDTAHYAIEAEKLAPEVLQRLDGFGDVGKALLNSGAKYKADLDAIAKPLFANIEGESGVKQQVYIDEELRRDFNLNDRQIGMYQQIRKSVDASLERLAQTTIAAMAESAGMETASLKNLSLAETAQRVKEGTDTGEIGRNIAGMTRHEDLHERIDEIVAQTTRLQESGYMPAMRFGNFAVTVREPNAAGDGALHFQMFESQTKANLAAMQLAKKYPGMETSKSIMNQDRFKMFKGVSPETVELFAKFSGMDQDAAYKDYIALAKSGRSTAKRMLERKGIAGFSEEVTRVLASFITSNARQSAMNMNGGEINAAMASKELAERGDVQREAQKLHEYLSNPQEEAQRLRGFMFIHFIGGSVASAAVNLTQPVLQTGPYLSQYAGTKTPAILAKSAKMALTNKIGNPVLSKAMERARANGIVDPHEIHNLMADASGATFGSSLRMRALTKAWGGFFAVSEAYNRRLTFLAAYQVAMNMGQEELTAKGFKDAYEFSRQAIIETQGLYSKTNRPNWARGAVGATLFTFKQFSISYVEFLTRLPRKQQLIALGILILSAGLQGIPFADDLEDLIDTLGQSLGYNTNSQRALHETMIALLGDDLGEIMTHGLSSQSNIDLQGRLGMGNLIPGTALFKMSEKDKSRTLSELAGPLGGVLASAQDAFAKAQGGNLMGKTGALATMAPVAVRNLMQGLESADTGTYTDTKGRKVQDVGLIASLMKSLGFQPIEIAQESHKMSEMYQDKGMLIAVSSAISERWAAALAAGDQEGVTAARETLRNWNENNPESKINIKPANIMRRVREMRITKQQRFIKTLPKSMRAHAIEEFN